MTRVLVLYGTTDGHTRLVADVISETLALAGLDTDVIQAGTIDPRLREYAGTIVAASVHGGRYQKDVEHWVRAHAAELSAQPTAFVSVCLAVLAKSNPKTAADLDAVVARFLATTGWRPTIVKHVAGALLYTRYGIFKRWIMKRIVARSGGATDTSKDYDYTDWADLRAFANEFRRRVSAAA
jgi:menaquinone-dependent protoporphyrinogen oxidase